MGAGAHRVSLGGSTRVCSCRAEPDVPVALTIGFAFSGDLHATYPGAYIYFDLHLVNLRDFI